MDAALVLTMEVVLCDAAIKIHSKYKMLESLINVYQDQMLRTQSLLLAQLTYQQTVPKVEYFKYQQAADFALAITLKELLQHRLDKAWDELMEACWNQGYVKRYRRHRKKGWYVRGRKGDCFKPSRILYPCKRLPSVFAAPSSKAGMSEGETSKVMRFDTDSYLLVVDPGASYSMTNNCNDYIPGTVEEVHVPVDGVGTTVSRKRGTVRWRIQDDDGKTFEFIIPGVYHLPTLSTRLFSPQHWAQVNKTKGGAWRGIERLDGEAVVLSWDGGEHRRTVPIHPRHNIFLLQTAPAFREYKAFLHEARHTPGDELEGCKCFPATAEQLPTYITDDEEEYGSDNDDESSTNKAQQPLADDRAPDNGNGTMPSSDGAPDTTEATTANSGGTSDDQDAAATTREGPMCFSFHDDSSNEREEHQSPEGELTSVVAEFIRWHYRLSHMPFQKMKILARLGLLPRKFADCRVPQCCLL